jgi:hypothetical protein
MPWDFGFCGFMPWDFGFCGFLQWDFGFCSFMLWDFGFCGFMPWDFGFGGFIPWDFGFYTPVERRDVLCYGVVHPSVVISVFRTFFFAIFAAIGLKLGVLLCSRELLFQFVFRCD